MQLLSRDLHRQIFPGDPLPRPPSALLNISKSHLGQNGLSPEGAGVVPEINLPLPPLEGDNIRTHFHALGHYAAEPYMSMAREFARAELPPMPERWAHVPGWTRYGRDGSVEHVEDLKGERLVCFDVETLYKLSQYPVMATAASPDAWYSWLSPSIFEDPPNERPKPNESWDRSVPKCHPRTLIPLFGDNKQPTIAVGHNVGYDRGRVADEYSLDLTPTRWLDTLSLHVATRGITSVQRPAWMKHRKIKETKAQQRDETIEYLQEVSENDDLLKESLAEFSANMNDDPAIDIQTWEDTTAVNSLTEVARLHCGVKVDKTVRDRFGDEDILHASQLRPELDDLLRYCAKDVQITHDVYKVVLPLFMNSCPHPATFAGVLAMGSAFLPVDRNWEKYLKNAESMYIKLRTEVRQALRTLADRLRREGPNDQDPWSSQLDWTPKKARWSDGTSHIAPVVESTPEPTDAKPAWYTVVTETPDALLSNQSERNILPLLLKLKYKGYPVYYLNEHWWCFRAPLDDVSGLVEEHGMPLELGPRDAHLEPMLEDSAFFRVPSNGKSTSRRSKLTGKPAAKDVKSEVLTSPYPAALTLLTSPSPPKSLLSGLQQLAEMTLEKGDVDQWTAQLDWSTSGSPKRKARSTTKKTEAEKYPHGTWPKWYWELTVPESNKKFVRGELDLTMRKSVAPLLLRMQWHGYPLVYSKEFKWLYRVPKSDLSQDKNSTLSEKKAVKFFPIEGNEQLLELAEKDYAFFQLPHKDGEGNNVGNPLSKSFLKAVESGELSSALADDEDKQLASAAKAATNMNALCSYWISSRERIMNQFVVYDKDGDRGMILPQVITMGTVTRRAVEATWLTASNAKKNRVGSELKSLVKAPPGYAIVGADVDSEELWISSVMGDSQFGMHGATAIGWMTLEGTKSAGTDLHSKTASILNISRDAAKVFNYSRIYGAGKPHAIQLLLQGDGKLTKEAADELATNLYKQTKGAKTFRSKGRGPAASQYLWHGGSESYLFNTLEAIALMDRPTTPALGCGVTRALRKSFLDAGHSYLPSRINWVVQSSGVDYLHLLITSMEYLTKKYDIKARYLISVHDEVRYLAAEEDKLRTALALQIANAWTRALFCYNLGLDDMPQGIAFFSAVDIDHILRKETDMPCVTPSSAEAIPPGESLDIKQLLDTGVTLGKSRFGPLPRVEDEGPPVAIFKDIRSVDHQRFLEAQASSHSRAARFWLDSQPRTDGLEDSPESATPAPRRKRKSTKTTTPKKFAVSDADLDSAYQQYLASK